MFFVVNFDAILLHQFPERFQKVISDRPWLAITDYASIHFNDGDDLCGRPSQEYFICNIDIVS